MIIYHDVIQGTEEWHKLRVGKLTASNATAIGANGAGLKTYCKSIVKGTIGIHEDTYINSDMIRGTELEPLARMSYEFETGLIVKEVGFITNDKYKDVGISPDGVIENVGGVETKARNNDNHLSLILGETKQIPLNQIQMTLLITERKWWDFVSFNPNFTKPIFIKRIFPDLQYFEKLKQGFASGYKLIEDYKNIYNNYNCNGTIKHFRNNHKN